MKKMIWLNIMFLLSCNVYSQKLESGSLFCLKGEKQLNVVVDFSQSKIDGLSEQDFIWKMSVNDSRGTGWEEYWKNECYRVFLGKFCLSAFEVTQDIGLRLGAFPEAKYTAVFQIQTVDDDGEVWGVIRIEETETGMEQAVITKVNGDGGRWGSIENLIGDAMERAGKIFGKFIRRNLSLITSETASIGQEQINNGGKRLAIRFPENLSPAYSAFRNGSIYNMSKTEKESTGQTFVSEIINDLKNAITWEDFEIISTKIKYLDQYSAIQPDMKDTVKMLKESLNKNIETIEK